MHDEAAMLGKQELEPQGKEDPKDNVLPYVTHMVKEASNDFGLFESA